METLTKYNTPRIAKVAELLYAQAFALNCIREDAKTAGATAEGLAQYADIAASLARAAFGELNTLDDELAAATDSNDNGDGSPAFTVNATLFSTVAGNPIAVDLLRQSDPEAWAILAKGRE